ncbi:hypothetical protein HYH02_014349 [Chlamydomonas schloesseri]|uniref:Glycosyl transferase CAP10 domain-containing protein n=1 Tax=Chlamydomonas schloesseri TaxID=2026947 RepID=A0A835VUM9_9CHLO|nr:hypothetical protein HYH02_014349 [Chlamydomonas schloesseri]|eukprot:KAG2428545.1 hypothetical protein HYH02_014349 [Chlamydomonas schloesseri]
MQLKDGAPPFLDHAEGLGQREVLVLPLPRPGYEPASGPEWDAFLRQNLGEDLRKYGNATPPAAPVVTLAALHVLMSRLWRSSAKRSGALVVLRGGGAYMATHRGVPGYIRTRLTVNLQELVRGARRLLGRPLPDTLFAYNAQDEPVCGLLRGACDSAPLFSHIKKYDWARGRSLDSDVLVPHMGHDFNSTTHFPWPAKDPRAVLRARLQSSMDARTCMRVALAKLSASPTGRALLDAGFVQNRHHSYRPPADHMRPYLSMPDHARYRLLLNADGHTASSRLGYLLTIDSPVLTQHSPWIEYYYRSLNRPPAGDDADATAAAPPRNVSLLAPDQDPGSTAAATAATAATTATERLVLYYNESNILDLVRQLQDPAHDAALRAQAAAAQRFAAKFITPDQKVRYWVEAVQAYAALMPPGLSAVVAGLKLKPAVAGGSGGEPRLGSASGTAILDALKAASRASSNATSSSSGSSSKSSSKSKSKGKSKSKSKSKRRKALEMARGAIMQWWTGDLP